MKDLSHKHNFDHSNMQFFFNPESIALIGATPSPKKGGHATLKNLMRGFPGQIYPVNPNYKEIEGLKCFARVEDIPAHVDLAIIFIPAVQVPASLRDCAAHGVKGVMINSGGFAETGEEGKKLQEECRTIGITEGIRIWGPNCMGLVDAHRNYVFSFLDPTLWADGLTSGEVSLVVQSGMLSGSFLVDLMSHGTMGISKVCSIGNKIDVDECDLLDYLIADPATAAVALYLEAIPQGRRFLEIARRSQKPIVVLKGGRSLRGARSAFSHTASLAGDDRIVRGVFAQANITAANDFYHMMDLARGLAMVPGGMGQGRVGVLTFTGSGGILSADFFADAGMCLADISDESRQKLRNIFPPWMPVDNPVDLWPAVEIHGGKAYHLALEVALEDSGIDAILIQIFVGGFGMDLDLEKIAVRSRENHKPVFFWILGIQQSVKEFQKEAQKLGMPVFREISKAVAAMQAVYSYHNRKKTQRIIGQFAVSVSDKIQAALLKKIRQMDPGTGVLDELDSKNVLAAAGIPTVSEAAVSDPTEALAVAKKIGFPVVLKGLATGQIHKTEHGLVRLKIQNSDQLISDFEDLTKILKGQGRVIIQKYIGIDLEFICGMIRDPQFGPAVMFGIGGMMAEVYQDVVFRVAPLSDEEALDMLRSIRAKKLLEGFRGKPPVDYGALAQVLITLGSIGRAAPRISQIDINPLVVSNRNLYALDATMIVANKL